jgi:hypothetical protein
MKKENGIEEKAYLKIYHGTALGADMNIKYHIEMKLLSENIKKEVKPYALGFLYLVAFLLLIVWLAS